MSGSSADTAHRADSWAWLPRGFRPRRRPTRALALQLAAPPAASTSEAAESQAERLYQAAAVALLAATVLFNPLLAIVNAQLFTLTGGMVAAVQASLVAAAFGLALVRAERTPIRWLLLAAALVASNLALAVARDAFNPKYLGDVLTIPAFLCLGARVRREGFIRLLIGLQILIAVVGVWELLDPQAYAFVLNPRSYYMNTRGFVGEVFSTSGDLFVSSVRGGGRYLLAWTDFHRGSSIFLEPISLGNWTTLVAVLLATFWSDMKAVARVLLIGCNVVSLCVCDGRLALVTNLLLAAGLPLLRWAPSRLAALTPFGFGAAALLAKHFGFLESRGDDFGGRLRYSLEVLQQTDLAAVLGLKPFEWVDAGFSYLIQTQSALAALGLWLVLMLSDFGEDAPGRRLKFGTAIAMTLCLSVSFSIFSVKVSGLLWAAFGILWSRSGALGDLQLVLRPQAATASARAPRPLVGRAGLGAGWLK